MEETLPALDEVEVSAVAIYSVTGTVNDAAALRYEGGQTASSSATRLRTWF